MTAKTKLRVTCFEQLESCNPRLELGMRARKRDRARLVRYCLGRVSCVTVRAANIVAPVLAPAEIIMLLSACVTRKARFRNLFRRFVFEGDDFCFVTVSFNVILARSVARLTTQHFTLPALVMGQYSVLRLRESVELIFVAALTGFVADIITAVLRNGDCSVVTRRRCSRRRTSCCPNEHAQCPASNDGNLEESKTAHVSLHVRICVNSLTQSSQTNYFLDKTRTL